MCTVENLSLFYSYRAEGVTGRHGARRPVFLYDPQEAEASGSRRARGCGVRRRVRMRASRGEGFSEADRDRVYDALADRRTIG